MDLQEKREKMVTQDLMDLMDQRDQKEREDLKDIQDLKDHQDHKGHKVIQDQLVKKLNQAMEVQVTEVLIPHLHHMNQNQLVIHLNQRNIQK